MPKPISSTRGAARPNTASQSGCCGSYGSTKRGPNSSIARRWPVETRPARVTKLRIRRKRRASFGSFDSIAASPSSACVADGSRFASSAVWGSSPGWPAWFGSWIIFDGYKGSGKGEGGRGGAACTGRRDGTDAIRYRPQYEKAAFVEAALVLEFR